MQLLFKKICILTLFIPVISFADDVCKYSGNTDQINFFPLSIKAGKQLSENLCNAYLNELVEGSGNSTNIQRIWYENVMSEASGLISLNKQVATQIDIFNNKYRTLDAAILNMNNDDDVAFMVTADDGVKLKKDDCIILYNSQCKAVIQEYKVALELPYNEIKQNISLQKVTTLDLISSNWQRFFEERRSMYSWELAVNTAWYKKELTSNQNIEPPSMQWIVFHPTIVMQNSPEEMDGDQFKQALAIELLGINFWDLSVPLGASVVATYADRADGDDMTYGLMFHVSNDLSIGVTHIGGENNIFINIDLLKLFEDKRSNFKDYISSAKEYF